MGKGCIEIRPETATLWFFKGKRIEDIKELLQLPDNFEITNVIHSVVSLCVIVSSDDIPDIPPHSQIPIYGATYYESPHETKIDAKIELEPLFKEDRQGSFLGERRIKISPFSFELDMTAKEGEAS